MIKLLGTPVFFSAPEPNWLQPADSMAKLYVVVTGLHQVYHDSGTQLLRSYLAFCENYSWDEPFVPSQHVARVAALRNGLCHRALPGGHLAKEFSEALQFYQITSWPPAPGAPCQSLCDRLTCQLCTEANEVLRYIMRYAEKISTSPWKRPRWRETLVREAMNPEHVLYGEKQDAERFFGINMVWDLANCYPGEKDKAALSRAVQQWLNELKPRLLKGRIKNSDTLPDTLAAAICALYEDTSIS